MYEHRWKMNVCGFAGTKPSSPHCTLENEDVLEKHFMKIETEPLAPLKTCSPQQQNPNSTELHIINILGNPSIR